jgi:uncharacterized protein (TIGR01777 family)
VVVLSRNPGAAQRLGLPVEAVAWDSAAGGEWERTLDGADAVVNLAGQTIASRWTTAQKDGIRRSRIEGTRALVAAVERAERRPTVLLSASGVGYYGPRGDEEVAEDAAPGDDFLANVCRDWEAEARRAEPLGVRVAVIRTGVVLGRDGGALPRLMLPFRLFVGGPIGSGGQGFPWIHRRDVVNLYRWALEDASVDGPLNAAGPQSLTNRQFCQILGRAMGRPCWLPAPAFALKLLLGEMAEALLLTGQRAIPRRTEQLGFRFTFTTAEAALQDLRAEPPDLDAAGWAA